MKKVTLILFLLVNFWHAKAQIVAPTNPIDTDTTIYVVVDEDPQFPGGTDKFMLYLAKNIRYPAESRINHIQGKVIVQMTIEKDGSITNPIAIRSREKNLDAEAVRVAGSSPKWKPAMKAGKPVRVKYTFPIIFDLGEAPQTVKVVADRLTVVKDSFLVDAVDIGQHNNIEILPSFPGGKERFYNFIRLNYNYNNNEIVKVLVSYIVEKDGALSDVKMIKGLNQQDDAEIIKAIKKSPKWKPAVVNDKVVRFYQIAEILLLPTNFQFK